MKIIVIAKAQNRRLPRKHFLEVAGRPLIHWAVLDAVAVPDVPIVIATDSGELNDFAAGAVPASDRGRVICLRRPARLSEPRCSGWEPFFWAMAETESRFSGAALLVQGSVPVRPPWLLREAAQIMQRDDAPHVLYSAYRQWQADHGACYRIDGGVYGLAQPETDERTVKNRALQAYLETRPGDCVDVDTPEDLDRVGAILTARKSG
jgi:CMP-N-acetylneuraminic acid synthetase